MSDDELDRHLRDIVACRDLATWNAALARLRQAIDEAVRAERERVVREMNRLHRLYEESDDIYRLARFNDGILAIRNRSDNP